MKDLIYLTIILALGCVFGALYVSKYNPPQVVMEKVRPGPPPDFTLWPEDGPQEVTK